MVKNIDTVCDWLAVSIKKHASSCTCHSLSKMAECQDYMARKRQQRRENTSKKRQDQFISDYIYHKYGAIYNEAAQYYNLLNLKYPTKYDLRKNDEYRRWKRQVTGQPERATTQKYIIPIHPCIQSSSQIHPESTLTVFYGDEQTIASEIPGQNEMIPSEIPVQNETIPSEIPVQNETIASEIPVQNETISSEIPVQNEMIPSEIPVQNETIPSEIPVQNETIASEIPVQNETIPSKIPVQNETIPSEIPDQNAKTVYEDCMQLKIPLLKMNKKPSVTTETLQIVTEEILQEGNQIEPSLHEEIDQEVIEKIINELRNEPELQDAFSRIEQQIEVEQIGMEIDIFEDLRLEDELENLMFR